MKIRFCFPFFFSITILIISACIPATPGPGPSQVWILAPGTGAVLPLAPITLKFEGASFVGISTFEIRVDGVVQANVPPLGSGSCGANCGTKFYAQYQWSPPGNGEYTISIRALGNGVYSPAAEIEVTIVEIVEEGDPLFAQPTPTPLEGYLPLPIPDSEKEEPDPEPTSPPAGRP